MAGVICQMPRIMEHQPAFENQKFRKPRKLRTYGPPQGQMPDHIRASKVEAHKAWCGRIGRWGSWEEFKVDTQKNVQPRLERGREDSEEPPDVRFLTNLRAHAANVCAKINARAAEEVAKKRGATWG